MRQQENFIMNSGLNIPVIDTLAPVRPGWIPSDAIYDWNSSPYAYQTEEELMPAGGLHGQLLGYLMELLRHTLQSRGLMLLLDVFLLYRDKKGIKQRIGPDLLLMPDRFPPPSAYDLDKEPPPLCVVEITSPKSHLADLKEKVPFYLSLGIPIYLVIDAVTPYGEARQQIELHLWRLVGDRRRKIRPDAQGRLELLEMGLSVQAQGRRLRFFDSVTGAALFDTGQLLQALEEERQSRLKERQARLKERQARLQAEAENERLRAELKKLRNKQ